MLCSVGHNGPCQGRLKGNSSGLWAWLGLHLGVQEALHAPAAQDDAAPPPTCQAGMLPHPHAHATCMHMEYSMSNWLSKECYTKACHLHARGIAYAAER